MPKLNQLIKKNWIIVLIVLISFILRFYKLGINPPSLDWDETAHGYNAYSILKTGRDEYGYRFPLSFRSFDDYKPPLYTYLVVPSVALFGLDNFAVRAPSALLGTFAVLATYLMVYQLLKKQTIAILAAFFLAISPWHLQFSRVAFETNTAILWSVLGTWTFLRGVQAEGRKIAIWLSLSAVTFGAGLFTYHNERVFVPIYGLMLIVLYRKKLITNLKYLVIPTAITMVFLVVLIPILLSVSGQLRYKGTTIFSDVSPQYQVSKMIEQDNINPILFALGKIIHNRRLVYLPILTDNYLSHFRPTFLFFTADINRHHAPDIGLLYVWDLPFILAGLYFLTKNDYDFKSKIIIYWWLMVAPIAAAVTWGVPHALRSEILLPTFQIFAAIGAYTLYKHLKDNKIYLLIVTLALAFNVTFYLHQYYVHMPTEYSQDWLYGRDQAAIFSDSLKNKYDTVIVSTMLEQPHEFWLYYLKYDPKKYQAQGGTVSGGFLENRNKFDKYQFKPINYTTQKDQQHTLFVGLPQEFPSGAPILKKINYLNDQPAIYVVGDQL